MTEKPKKKKSIKLALFLPWDENGRVFLNEDHFITKDTQSVDSKIIPFPTSEPPQK